MERRPEIRNRSARADSPAGWLERRRTTAGLALLALLIGWGLFGEYLRSRDLQEEIDRLETREREMEEKNRELAVASDNVSSEALLEREARLKMNLRRPGEEVVVIDGTTPSAGADTETRPDSSPSPSNWSKWWRYFSR